MPKCDNVKLHILPTGFTARVFTDASGTIVREGADRIISIHMPYPSAEIKLKVEKTITEVERVFRKKIERRIIRAETFSSLVIELIGLLDSFGIGDTLFLHIGGGERHLGLALVYASSFAKRNAVLIPVLEYGSNGRKFRFEELPPIIPEKPTPSQMRVLSCLHGTRGITLSEIAKKTGRKYSSAAPSLIRHLKNLRSMNLVSFNRAEKTYHATTLAEFFRVSERLQ